MQPSHWQPSAHIWLCLLHPHAICMTSFHALTPYQQPLNPIIHFLNVYSTVPFNYQFIVWNLPTTGNYSGFNVIWFEAAWVHMSITQHVQVKCRYRASILGLFSYCVQSHVPIYSRGIWRWCRGYSLVCEWAVTTSTLSNIQVKCGKKWHTIMVHVHQTSSTRISPDTDVYHIGLRFDHSTWNQCDIP